MSNELQGILPGLKKDVPLAPHTTFRIGGAARYFFIAKTKDDVVRAVRIARDLHIPFFILGGGSNVLASDKGFQGLVIHIRNTKYKISPYRGSRVAGQNTRLYAEAGVSMATLVKETTKKGLAGLEWAGGLPGSVGGAVRGNAGAFGGETKDCLERVECVDGEGSVRTLEGRACHFGYRTSIFKEKKWIVLSAVFRLTKRSPSILKKIANEHIQYRKERHPLEFPNAGSIFKNCDYAKIPVSLRTMVKDAVKTDPFPVVPAAFLINKANLKGKRVGGAQISEKHPNYIVKVGDAKASDVHSLIKKVKEIVKKKFSVRLEEEIEQLKSYAH